MVRIEPILKPLEIVIDRTPKVHEQAEAVESAWQGLCAHNPRYFNGSMLAFDSYDSSTGEIRATVEQYKHHAVRDVVDTGIYLLAVTGILVAPDENGTPRYLLGRRSPGTHRYGGLWELGPSGGVDVPDERTDVLDLDAIVGELQREIVEEVGIDIQSTSISPTVLVHDDAVGSVDIAIRIGLESMPKLERSWEYTECRWVSLDELRAWNEDRPADFIPTTIALALRLGS